MWNETVFHIGSLSFAVPSLSSSSSFSHSSRTRIGRPSFHSFVQGTSSPPFSKLLTVYRLHEPQYKRNGRRINFLPSSEKLEGYYKYLARRIKGTQCTVEKPWAIYDRLSSINILPWNWAQAWLAPPRTSFPLRYFFAPLSLFLSFSLSFSVFETCEYAFEEREREREMDGQIRKVRRKSLKECWKEISMNNSVCANSPRAPQIGRGALGTSVGTKLFQLCLEAGLWLELSSTWCKLWNAGWSLTRTDRTRKYIPSSAPFTLYVNNITSALRLPELRILLSIWVIETWNVSSGMKRNENEWKNEWSL